MKRYLAAVGVGTLFFGAVLGSASALGIDDAGVAQYGESFNLTCDNDGVTVDGYFPDTDAGAPSVSNGVVVSGISDACDGKTLVASVADADGNALARGAATIDGTTMTISYNIDGDQVPYSQIGGVRLTIG